MNIYQMAIDRDVVSKKIAFTEEELKEAQERNEISQQAKDAWSVHPVTVDYKESLNQEFNKLIESAMNNAEKGDNDRAILNLIKAKTIKEKL